MSDELCISCNHGESEHHPEDAEFNFCGQTSTGCDCDGYRDGGDQEMPYEERESSQSRYERSWSEHVRLHS